MLTCVRLSEKRGSFDETRLRGGKHGKFGQAESTFLLGEAIFEIVRGRFASSAILEYRINGQELASRLGISSCSTLAKPRVVLVQFLNPFSSIKRVAAPASTRRRGNVQSLNSGMV